MPQAWVQGQEAVPHPARPTDRRLKLPTTQASWREVLVCEATHGSAVSACVRTSVRDTESTCDFPGIHRKSKTEATLILSLQ